jgi:hypothetical protein
MSRLTISNGFIEGGIVVRNGAGLTFDQCTVSNCVDNTIGVAWGIHCILPGTTGCN